MLENEERHFSTHKRQPRKHNEFGRKETLSHMENKKRMMEMRDASERTETYKRDSRRLRVKRDDAGLCMTSLCGADNSERNILKKRSHKKATGKQQALERYRSMCRTGGTERRNRRDTQKRRVKIIIQQGRI